MGIRSAMNNGREEPDSDEIDISLRPATLVGQRMVILAAVCRRAFLESRGAARDLDEDPEIERFDLRMWLHEHGLDDELVEDESALFEATVGGLHQEAAIAATWNSEALVTLAWATEMIEALPSPDRATDPSSTLAAIPSPWDDSKAWIAAVILREEGEIAQERERAEIWLWRAEVERERRESQGRARQVLEADIGDVVREAIAVGLLPRGSGRDFTAFGRPFNQLGDDELDDVTGMAEVRLHTLNWLCGFGDAWDDVPLDIE